MSRAIRELDATVPIVILSVHTQLELADAQQAIGFTEVFLKSVHPNKIKLLLECLCHKES